MAQLKKLSRLTPIRLIEAIAAVRASNSRLSNLVPAITDISASNVHSVLLDLLSEQEDSKRSKFIFGYAVLQILLADDGQRGQLPVLKMSNELLSAVRIFLKFKIQGAQYKTCLHDALNCDDYVYKNELSALLVEHGADPDQENEKYLSAFALQVIKLFPASKYNTSHLASKTLTPFEKLQKLFIFIKKEDAAFFTHLISYMNLYGLFKKHPKLLEVTFGLHAKSLLTFAVHYCNAHTVRILLNEGADINYYNALGEMPIHYAIYRSVGIDQAESIALLISAEWDRSLISMTSLSCHHVVIKLFSFNMPQKLRKDVCREFMEINSEKMLKFSLTELLSVLDIRFKILQCDNIVLTKQIQKSSHGNIFLALHANMQESKKCVVKLPIKEYGVLRTMEDEIAILSRMNHRNVITLLNVIIKNDVMGYSMPYAAHGTLQDFIKKNDLKLLQVNFYSFGSQLNHGLRYIHSLGFAHLDFSAANIFLMEQVNQSYHLRIGDFGAAAKFGVSKAGHVTTDYVRSPELEDTRTVFTPQNDIYSFGILMGCMAATEIIWQPTAHKHNDFYTPKQNVIFQLALWCCQFEPSKRPSHDEIDEKLDREFKI